MAWNSRTTLTIDEFSMLMASIDPGESHGYIYNPIDYLCGSLEAFSWRELVVEALITGVFANDDCRIYVGDVIEGISVASLDLIDFDSSISTSRTRILTKSLLNWVESLGHKIPPMLIPPSTSNLENNNASPIDDRWIEIEQLLNGTHQFQPEGLKTAIDCWLGVTKLYKNKLETASTPKQEIEAWLEDNGSELSDSQRERIAYVVNWNKNGGRPSSKDN